MFKAMFKKRPSPTSFSYVCLLLFLLASCVLYTGHRNGCPCSQSVSEPLRTPGDIMADMVQLLLHAHDTLNKLNVPHYLCYSTLLGAVYTGAILSWDRTVNLCVLEEDISMVDGAILHDTFRGAGVDSFYSSFHGYYKLRLHRADGTLTVYRKGHGERVKAGFYSRLLLLFYKDVESFPNGLLDSPFVNVSLYGSLFLVPRESVSFIKSLSPSELWELTELQSL